MAEGIGASEAALRSLERATGDLMTATTTRLESRLGWYAALPASERSWVGLIAQAGISSFIAWCRDPSRPARLAIDIFGAAPRDLTRSITLGQTVDLVRCVVETVEDHVLELVAAPERSALNLAVLRYSREVAFAAAQVYADAAETRGAWDARLESLVVDAVLRGEVDDELTSRAAALGWGEIGPVTVVVGSTPRTGQDDALAALRAVASRHDVETLIAVQGRRLVVILGGPGASGTVEALLAHFGEGAVVVGPTVPRLFAAGRSARAALNGLRAAGAWPRAPRPVEADDLLPERVLIGDVPARTLLVERVYHPLAKAGGALIDTADAYLATGGAIEASARELFVHANTVRYRLGRIAEVTGYDLTVPREAHVVRTALALGRLDALDRHAARRPATREHLAARGRAETPASPHVLEDSSNK